MRTLCAAWLLLGMLVMIVVGDYDAEGLKSRWLGSSGPLNFATSPILLACFGCPILLCLSPLKIGTFNIFYAVTGICGSDNS
ncbi:hypothetical protein B0H13DRAFT_2094765 [Mycena leptocephala]|nr:hypothetical protein B0H13DRAFT_2094765 [Mycena leptocephala]